MRIILINFELDVICAVELNLELLFIWQVNIYFYIYTEIRKLHVYGSTEKKY